MCCGFGFGYDYVSDKYMVVLVFRCPRYDNVDRTITVVYPFGDSSWKTIENLSVLGYPTLKFGKFVSCSLNWIVLVLSTREYWPPLLRR